MRIALDARALRRPMAGIGRYVWHLGRALAEELPEATFLVVGCRPLDIDLPGPPERWLTCWDPAPGWGALPRLAWLRWRAGHFAKSLGADVFWGCSLQIPSLTAGIPTVLTAYDLVHREAPETLDLKARIALRLFLARDLRRADAVAAISQGTADRIQAWSGRVANVLVRPAVDDQFCPPAPEAIKRLRMRLHLPQPFVLALGTHEPRKNLALLAEAWREARANGHLGQLKLVLAGRAGWCHAATDHALRALGADLVNLGYVPNEDLPTLIGTAEALVFPTRYEGFGMPVAEALACGTPVFCADAPELREASQGAHHTISLDRASLAKTLHKIAAGNLPRPQATLLPWSWRSEAVAMAEVFRRLAAPHAQPDMRA